MGTHRRSHRSSDHRLAKAHGLGSGLDNCCRNLRKRDRTLELERESALELHSHFVDMAAHWQRLAEESALELLAGPG